MWWVLYRDGDSVHVQNQLLIFENLMAAFEEEEPWKSIGPRKILSEEGLAISEWRVALSDIEDCVHRRCR
jgi:hypothetical protein